MEKKALHVRPFFRLKKSTRSCIQDLPITFFIVRQQLLHHVLHSDKPAGHSFVDQWGIRPEGAWKCMSTIVLIVIISL